MTGYVYFIEDTQHSKFYIGSHKGTVNDGYICSSKIVKEQMKERPSDFRRVIVAIGTYEDMISLESSLLRKVNAKVNPNYYNLHNGDGKFYCKFRTKESIEKSRKGILGRPLSEQHKSKLRKSHTGKKRSISHVANMKKSRIKHYTSLTSEQRKDKYGKNKGKSIKNKGYNWYHNPITWEQKMTNECPKGFVKGRGKVSP
jgi:hypothetical protein